VLLAMGIEPQAAHGSLRLTLGRGSSEDEVRLTVEAMRRLLERMRGVGQGRPEVASV
jgi:cysteine desulfurase